LLLLALCGVDARRACAATAGNGNETIGIGESGDRAAVFKAGGFEGGKGG